jgi:hypothetical protein
MFPGLLGFFAGAIIYGLIYPLVFPLISKIANVGKVVLPDLWNLNPYLTVFLFALIVLFLFYLIDRAGLQRKDKGE